MLAGAQVPGNISRVRDYQWKCSSRDSLCGLVVRVPRYRSRDPGFDSLHYQTFWEVVRLDRSPLSLASTVEEVLGRNSGSGLEDREYGRGDLLRWPRDTLYPQKLALTLPTSGGRSGGIVRSRTKATDLVLSVVPEPPGLELGVELNQPGKIYCYETTRTYGIEPLRRPRYAEGCSVSEEKNWNTFDLYRDRNTFTVPSVNTMFSFVLRGDCQLRKQNSAPSSPLLHNKYSVWAELIIQSSPLYHYFTLSSSPFLFWAFRIGRMRGSWQRNIARENVKVAEAPVLLREGAVCFWSGNFHDRSL
jgi:hypothetical protein